MVEVYRAWYLAQDWSPWLSLALPTGWGGKLDSRTKTAPTVEPTISSGPTTALVSPTPLTIPRVCETMNKTHLKGNTNLSMQQEINQAAETHHHVLGGSVPLYVEYTTPIDVRADGLDTFVSLSDREGRITVETVCARAFVEELKLYKDVIVQFVVDHNTRKDPKYEAFIQEENARRRAAQQGEGEAGSVCCGDHDVCSMSCAVKEAAPPLIMWRIGIAAGATGIEDYNVQAERFEIDNNYVGSSTLGFFVGAEQVAGFPMANVIAFERMEPTVRVGVTLPPFPGSNAWEG